MEQTELSKIIKRRHPEYADQLDHWNFLSLTYKGGRAWFDDNIFKYHKEGDSEFKARLKRAYRFNHSREIVDLVGKYSSRGVIARSESAPEVLKQFWLSASRKGWDIDQFMRVVGRKSSTMGRIWLVVDATQYEGAVSVADANEGGHSVYAYEVMPQDVLDMGYDDDEELTWIMIRETARDDSNPLSVASARYSRYRIWTRNGWYLIEPKGGEQEGFKITDGQHDLSVVPVFPVDNAPTSELYTSPALINDIAYLDRAVANYLSNLDAIIQDQTFSQLAMPAQALLPGDDAKDKVIEMGTKRVFLFDGEGGQPVYLSPDPKQAQMIITAIKQIVNEIYHSVGVAGERTKQDNSAGIDNSSGVAKAFDFERVNSLLLSKGKEAERAERKLCELVLRYKGVYTEGMNTDYVEYPSVYDVRGFAEEVAISTQFEEITVPIELKRHQLKRVIEKLYPQLSDEDRKDLELAVDSLDDATDLFKQALGGSPGANSESDSESAKDSE